MDGAGRWLQFDEVDGSLCAKAKSEQQWQKPWSLLKRLHGFCHFEPTRKEDEVIKRPEMDTIKERIKSWRYNATIIGGRFQSGKSVAVEEALRGVRGVVRFTIKSADWEKVMCKRLKVDDEGMFVEVMSRVHEKLKDFPDNLTKYPILLLDIPRRTTVGQSVFSFGFVFCRWCGAFCQSCFFVCSNWQGIDEISTTAKVLASDQQGAAVHAPSLNHMFKSFKHKKEVGKDD